MSSAIDFIVNRADLRQCAVEPGRDTPATPLAQGQALMRVDAFAFTANNITYGAVGDLIGYWNFFPAREGWGRIPAWGFGEVISSQHQELHAGERIYGYFPMSTHLIVQPDHITAAAFIDATPHRAALPAIYNQYTRAGADPGYDSAHEAEIALFRPLFTTAFLLDDFLAAKENFGARRIALSSASSKTALGLAFLLSQRRGAGIEVVGLTSPVHADFVRRTGYYTTVLAYDAIASLSAETATVFIDFAGNGSVLNAVHTHFGSQLKHSCQVGLTHWEARAVPAVLPGPQPEFFFAPEQARQRVEEWGANEFQRRAAAALRQFLASAATWLRLVVGSGPEAVEKTYRSMLEGKFDPAEGNLLTLWNRTDRS
jgi:hypothetical protein